MTVEDATTWAFSISGELSIYLTNASGSLFKSNDDMTANLLVRS